MTPFAIECRLPEPARRVATLSICPPGRVPRVARWLALAIRLEADLAAGTIADAASVARAWQVSRARVSQVLNLALLAPAIQEAVLFLPRVTAGRDPVTLGDLQPVALTPDWADQRKLFGKLRAARGF
jgi:hypothetical protein